MERGSLINPSLLKWARESSGQTIDEVVRKLRRKKITAEVIAAWKNGSDVPSYAVLERLAYGIYKRPLAIFFFPDPPEEETPRRAFRTLPDAEVEGLSSRILFLLRQASVMQANLSELCEGTDPGSAILHTVKFAPDAEIDDLARLVRQVLGVSLETQFQWKTSEAAFKGWRGAFEDQGVYVFKEAFHDDWISGFCIHDARFPIIFVNNTRAVTHQIFTLFHELAHLLSGTGGIDTLDDGYIEDLRGWRKAVEIRCNLFASRFLVPESDFDRRIGQSRVSETSVAELASLYNVSREVILRRCLDRDLVTSEFYEETVAKWRSSIVPRKPGGGGSYYNTKGSYLGDRYLELVFRRLYQNRITPNQAAEYLGIKERGLSRMEALLFSGGAAA